MVGNVEVAHHALDDAELLGIFAAEVGPVGLHDVEQLADDGGDAAEVSGPRCPLQAISEVLYVHEGAEVVRIHRACFRYEDGIHAPFFEHGKVARQVAGVGSEVFVRPKLQGIDEYRGPAQVVLSAGGMYQRHVARVQVPHGGHQPKAALDFLPSGANCWDGAQNLHEKILGGCWE